MAEQTPVEVTLRYSTTVDELPAAWAFVMDRLDGVGPHPSIEIKPFWQMSVQDMNDDPDQEYRRKFGVVVEGTNMEDNDG